jgi:antitoxin CcdA
MGRLRDGGVNVSRACEHGLAEDACQEKARCWQERNSAGFDAWDGYVESYGVPLSNYRKF